VVEYRLVNRARKYQPIGQFERAHDPQHLHQLRRRSQDAGQPLVMTDHGIFTNDWLPSALALSLKY
jgi:hypothetical protein